MSSAIQGEFEPGKIFVGGLSWETTPDSMRSYFMKFGDVSDCVVMKDPGGKPRGFGFVTFTDPSSVVKVVKGGHHVLDDKTIDPKPANMKGNVRDQINRKVFVGGLSFETEEGALKAFFESKGFPVTSVDMKVDPQNRKRGFAFVDFEQYEHSEEVCKQRYFMIDSKRVEVKKAEPKNMRDKGKQQQSPQGGAGGFPHTSVMPQYGHSTFGYPPGNDTRYSGVATPTQYNTGGAGYAYTQYGTGYGGDYSAAYNSQHGTSTAVFQNYGNSGYGGRGYSTTQQMGAYSQESGYGSQTRNGFPSTGGSDSYSGGAGYNSYDYPYSDQPSAANGTQSYRLQGTSNTSAGGQSRGTPSYQSYSSH